MAEIKYLRKITILFYSTTVKCHVLISSFTDVNESMKYVHKTSKRAHSGAAIHNRTLFFCKA